MLSRLQILQQRCAVSRVRSAGLCLYTGNILEHQTSTNIVHALESSLPELSTSRVQALAKEVYKWIFTQLMGDFVAANRLAQAILAHHMPNVCIDDGRCAMHQAHLTFLAPCAPLGPVSATRRTRLSSSGLCAHSLKASESYMGARHRLRQPSSEIGFPMSLSADSRT